MNLTIEIDEKYLTGTEIIYDKEENFFFVMYQSWSGSAEDSKGIKKIRNAAQRGLKEHPQALRLYWDRYAFEDGWTTLDDFYANNRLNSWRSLDGILYMPIKTLISVTKESDLMNDEEIVKKMNFWEGVLKDERIKTLEEVKDDQSTVRAAMLSAGLLKSPKKRDKKKSSEPIEGDSN